MRTNALGSTMAAAVFTAALATCGLAHGQCALADLDGDDTVGGADLAVLLGAWGRADSVADLTGDGTVDGADLALMLGEWGPVGTSGGVFPEEWIWGAPNCGTDPQIQVHQYNENTFILRQSICTNFEGPFIYLLFGEEKVLMEDTGASNVPLYTTVKSIIDAYEAKHAIGPLQLIVSHSHAHGDHVFCDFQFVGKPNTTVVGTSVTAVKNFFGIPNWPTQIVDFDLGGRVVQVIPIPGHQSSHIAIYDVETGFLLTGDTLYPGRLYISNWNDYRASIQRMVDFTASKPVCWVMGTHIEMSQTPGDDYPIGAPSHPNEHELELTRDHLLELNAACIAMGGSPVYQVHDDFIIFPLGGAANDAPNAAAQGDSTAAEGCCVRPHTMFEYRALRRRAEGR